MTSAVEKEAIDRALKLIDTSLGTMHTRELVSTAEVSDLLLDMRSVLALIRPESIEEASVASGVN